jgi:hypothetical protein
MLNLAFQIYVVGNPTKLAQLHEPNELAGYAL